MAHIPGLLSGLANAATAINAFDVGIENVRDVGTEALSLSQTLGDQAVNRSRFRPFTVTSGTGGVTTTPTGGIDLALSQPQQSIRDQLTGTAGQLFSQISPDRGSREQAIFDKLEALQLPGRERERLGLEERLFSQGRTGVRTSAFGGAPEQLAMAKAIEESRLSSAAQSIGLAGQEQQQFANIGTGLFATSQLPEKQLLEQLLGATSVADLAGTGARQGAQLSTALAQTGLESKIGAETVAANLTQQQIKAVTDLLVGTGGAGGTAGGGLFEQLIALIPGLGT